MTANLIACIISLSIGIIALGVALYYGWQGIKNGQDTILPAYFFLAIGFVFVLSAGIHWHDDDEYKEIKCCDYKVETIITNRNNQEDTTYVIHYKIK